MTELNPTRLTPRMPELGTDEPDVGTAGAPTTEAPTLLQQALEALELSQPLPGNEAKWSEAINAIYAHMDGVQPSDGGQGCKS